MKLLSVATIIVLAAVATGCSTYKARDEGLFKIGYEEKKLDDSSYQLAYYGATSDKEEKVKELWHKRANELCGGSNYEASTNSDNWVFDSYTVLPPLIFKNKGAAPLVSGRLKCN